MFSQNKLKIYSGYVNQKIKDSKKNIHFYSEMIVANAIIRGDRNKLLSFKKISNPVTLQVGGSNPNELAEACKISEDYGYSEINLNLGCPSKKVQKNKFGACLWQKQQSYQ